MTRVYRKRPRAYAAILADASVDVRLCLHHAVQWAVVCFQHQRVKILFFLCSWYRASLKYRVSK